MSSMTRVAAAFVIATLVSARPARHELHASDFVELKVSSLFAEHGDLLVQALVTRDPENRAIVITAASENYYTSSEVPLEGEFAARIKIVRFRDMPAGWYEVSGVVYDKAAHVKGSARTSVMVFKG